MIKIAHRGNIAGPNESRENAPEYLLEAIAEGYEVEVDVWVAGCMIYLGHDSPTYMVDSDFLNSISIHSWFHCKNLNALSYFINFRSNDRFFWHQSDDFTLTSNGFIWTYPGKQTVSNSIIVDLNLDNKLIDSPAGICTDYPSLIQ